MHNSSRKAPVYHVISRYDFLALILSVSLKHLSLDKCILCIAHVFNWNDGVFPAQIPLKIKSIVYVRLNFKKKFGIKLERKKIEIELCSSNFKNQTFLVFMLGAIIGTMIIF